MRFTIQSVFATTICAITLSSAAVIPQRPVPTSTLLLQNNAKRGFVAPPIYVPTTYLPLTPPVSSSARPVGTPAPVVSGPPPPALPSASNPKPPFIGGAAPDPMFNPASTFIAQTVRPTASSAIYVPVYTPPPSATVVGKPIRGATIVASERYPTLTGVPTDPYGAIPPVISGAIAVTFDAAVPVPAPTGGAPPPSYEYGW